MCLLFDQVLKILHDISPCSAPLAAWMFHFLSYCTSQWIPELKIEHYNNTAVFLQLQKWQFSTEKSCYFFIFAQKIDCGYTLELPQFTEAVLTSTHNLYFRAKMRKNIYPCQPKFYKGVRESTLHRHVSMINCFMQCAKSIWAVSWENQHSSFQPGATQTWLYSYRRWLETWNFGFRK